MYVLFLEIGDISVLYEISNQGIAPTTPLLHIWFKTSLYLLKTSLFLLKYALNFALRMILVLH